MKTIFGSLETYQKGNVVVIDDDPKNYVFSNIYETAAKSTPYERVCSAKNFEYVIEVARAEGQSGWYACAHDEFVVCMDGEVEVHLVKLDAPDTVIDMSIEGAQRLHDLEARIRHHQEQRQRAEEHQLRQRRRPLLEEGRRRAVEGFERHGRQRGDTGEFTTKTRALSAGCACAG